MEGQTKVWSNERDRQKYGQMRETDKSMVKWKRTKRQTTVVKILHRKLQSDQQYPH